ncbi:MAG: glycosyltransferase family 4 protein [Candidatus Berkelbacteria bacterium]
MKKVFVVTPAFSGGSWICTERLITEIARQKVHVFSLGLGTIFHRNKAIKYFAIPFPRYDKWGFLTSLSSAVALIWNIPLMIFSFVALIVYMPSLVIFNGFAAGLTIAPFAKLLRIKTVVVYHGYIEKNSNSFVSGVLRFLIRFLDLVVVNSAGSFDNISSLVNEEKVAINEHYADEIFFSGTIQRKQADSDKLNILYVGRLDSEKLCKTLVDIALAERSNKDYTFTFVGVGEYDQQLKQASEKGKSIKYIGYVSDRTVLRDNYKNADVVWSCADETYLALPAVEALACGTPIIIPKYAALPSKIEKKILVKSELVPAEIGWLVDPFDFGSVKKLFTEIRKNRLYAKMKDECRRYASKKYSRTNLLDTSEKILKLMR